MNFKDLSLVDHYAYQKIRNKRKLSWQKKSQKCTYQYFFACLNWKVVCILDDDDGKLFDMDTFYVE